MFANIPEVKLGIVAVSRDCFPIGLSQQRRRAIKEAYKGETLLNDHMEGEFPVLKPGTNLISWSGDATRIVIEPNWRYL